MEVPGPEHTEFPFAMGAFIPKESLPVCRVGLPLPQEAALHKLEDQGLV